MQDLTDNLCQNVNSVKYEDGALLMDASILRFVAASAALGIGCLHLLPLLQLLDRKFEGKVFDSQFPPMDDSFHRATFAGSGILGLWVGVRLAQTVHASDLSVGIAEMAWAYLIAMTMGSALFFRRSWLTKWALMLGVAGCGALYLSGMRH